MERVLNAKTIGEVMKCSGRFKKLSDAKIAYLTLSKLLHPDKNLHEGSTDAFKILQNANEKMVKNEPLSTMVLEIKRSSVHSTTASTPPKVISVQSKKKIISRITTCSAARMDIRAKISTASNVPNGLSEHVEKVINDCWEKRNKNGDIPVPEEGRIKLQCVKQVKSSFHWIKEIELDEMPQQTIVLMITVKEVREKTDDGNGWKDSLEVDLEDTSLNSMDSSKFTADVLWKRWKLMKEYIDRLFD